MSGDAGRLPAAFAGRDVDVELKRRAGEAPRKQDDTRIGISRSSAYAFLTPMYVRNETSVEWSDAARGVNVGHAEVARGPRGQEIKEAGRMIVQGG